MSVAAFAACRLEKRLDFSSFVGDQTTTYEDGKRSCYQHSQPWNLVSKTSQALSRRGTYTLAMIVWISMALVENANEEKVYDDD